MNIKINIFSDTLSNDFLNQLFPDYDLVFYKIKEVNFKEKFGGLFVLFLNNLDDGFLKKLSKAENKNLVISKNISSKLEINNNLTFLKTPVSANKIQNIIRKLISETKIVFRDIEIFDNKLINTTNNKHCFLTNIENEIFSDLIKERNLSKESIKKNILKVKKSIETNSVDSHLTRIRKKLEKIETKIIIQSKNNILSILAN